MKTFDEYQREAARTIGEDMMPFEVASHALHGMSAEIGEIHGLFQFQSTPIAGRHFGEDSLPSPTAPMITHAMMEDQANPDH